MSGFVVFPGFWPEHLIAAEDNRLWTLVGDKFGALRCRVLGYGLNATAGGNGNGRNRTKSQVRSVLSVAAVGESSRVTEWDVL